MVDTKKSLTAENTEDTVAEAPDRFDGTQLVRQYNDLFADEYYRKFIPEIAQLIVATKDRKNYTPLRLLSMQMELYKSLENLELASSEGKKLARNDGDEAIRLQSTRNKYLSKAIREVADGIAWRALGYDRFTFKVMTTGRSSGATFGKEAGRRAEFQKATNAALNGKQVLINDLTNCLRIGDLTMIPEKGRIALAEIKAKDLIMAHSIGKKIEKNRALDTQEYRLLQAQIALESRRFVIKDDGVDIVALTPVAHDFLPTANAILKKASKTGLDARMVAPYLRIDAVDLSVLHALDIEDVKRLINENKPPKMEAIIAYSNYDRLVVSASGEVLRSAPPLTVYPFPAMVIAKLITGEIYLTGTVYVQPLVEEFAKHGWEFIVDEKAIERYVPREESDYVNDFSGRALFPSVDAESLTNMMYIRNPKTYFMCPVGDMLAAMAVEFTSVPYIVSMATQMEVFANSERAASKPNKLKWMDIHDRNRWD